MCISIVFAVKLADVNMDIGEPEQDVIGFEKSLFEMGHRYGLGIGIGPGKLLPLAANGILQVMSETTVVFEVHDLTEPHCACDIDADIRNHSKLGGTAGFFDFVYEVWKLDSVRALKVLFFQDERPGDGNVRHYSGGFDEFTGLLNCWNTWQVPGFEPTRQAYFIADESPLLYTFTS